MTLCLVALGANVGDRFAALSRAIAQLSELPGVNVGAQSGWHETPAIGGPPGQGAYLNAVVALETSLPPHALLARLHAIEADLGRQRDVRYGPRTIDLDLLVFDQLVLNSAELTLPHPRMAFRRFVIEPAAEVAPDYRHPVIGWTLRALGEHLRHATPYVAITGGGGVGKTRLAARLAAQSAARLIADPRSAAIAVGERDAAGRDYAAEIELLDGRRRLLDAKSWAAHPRIVISDFWIAQSLAYAAAWNDDRQKRDLAAAVASAVATVVRPKLVILLNPAAALGAGGATRTAPESAEHVADVGAALARATAQPDVGPRLELTTAGDDANLAEASAAIAAMGN